MTTKDRLVLFLKHVKMGQNAFEQKIGAANGYISHNKGNIGSDVLVKIAEQYPKLSMDWLVTGNGTMLKQADAPANDSNPLAEEMLMVMKKHQAQIENLLEIINKILAK